MVPRIFEAQLAVAAVISRYGICQPKVTVTVSSATTHKLHLHTHREVIRQVASGQKFSVLLVNESSALVLGDAPINEVCVTRSGTGSGLDEEVGCGEWGLEDWAAPKWLDLARGGGGALAGPQPAAGVVTGVAAGSYVVIAYFSPSLPSMQDDPSVT